jgi:hypothetical protein
VWFEQPGHTYRGFDSALLEPGYDNLPETLNTKDVANERSFLLVTHTTSFDIQLDRYEFLNSDFAAEQILDRLTI